MTTIAATYLGDLRVECEHLQSGTKIITDAPTDLFGKGASFSPTDLCSTALGACAMTIMGIYANAQNIDLKGTRLEITKIMLPDHSRIARIEIVFHMPGKPYTSEQKAHIEDITSNCPVCMSINPEVERSIKVIWQN